MSEGVLTSVAKGAVGFEINRLHGGFLIKSAKPAVAVLAELNINEKYGLLIAHLLQTDSLMAVDAAEMGQGRGKMNTVQGLMRLFHIAVT